MLEKCQLLANTCVRAAPEIKINKNEQIDGTLRNDPTLTSFMYPYLLCGFSFSPVVVHKVT